MPAESGGDASGVARPLHGRRRGERVIELLLGDRGFELDRGANRQAVKDAGYIEGKNVAIYFRSANGQTDRLVTLAGDIVSRRVAVIVTAGGGAAALAAYAATTTIPIVFVSGVDPVTTGLVMSVNRPGSNATGVYIFQQALEGKRLGLLRELVPTATLIAVLLNPTNANFQTQLRGVQDAARDLGQQVNILSASTARDIDVAFSTATKSGAGALLVGSDPFFNSERDRRCAGSALCRSAILKGASLPAGGGELRTSLADAYREAGIYTGRILRARRLPSCLSCSQPSSSS
jgi:putative ABC transport system substrate-binding protein